MIARLVVACETRKAEGRQLKLRKFGLEPGTEEALPVFKTPIGCIGIKVITILMPIHYHH